MQTFRRTNATDAGGDYHVDELHNQVVYPFHASGRLSSLASLERRHRSVEWIIHSSWLASQTQRETMVSLERAFSWRIKSTRTVKCLVMPLSGTAIDGWKNEFTLWKPTHHRRSDAIPCFKHRYHIMDVDAPVGGVAVSGGECGGYK